MRERMPYVAANPDAYRTACAGVSGRRACLLEFARPIGRYGEHHLLLLAQQLLRLARQLHRKLLRWANHKHVQAAADGHGGDQRDEEGERFPRAGRRMQNHVGAPGNKRHGLLLDRHRSKIADCL